MSILLLDKSVVDINEYDEEFVLVDSGNGLELIEVSQLTN